MNGPIQDGDEKEVETDFDVRVGKRRSAFKMHI